MTTSASFDIEIGGRVLPSELAASIYSIEVATSVAKPASVSIELTHPYLDGFDLLSVTLGDSLRISVSTEFTMSSLLLFDGDVTAIESILTPAGDRTVLTGLDPLHRMQRGVVSSTFREAGVGDIVKEIAERYNFEVGEIDDGGAPRIDSINQLVMSDYSFLDRLARKVGSTLRWWDGALSFVPLGSAGDAPEPTAASVEDDRVIAKGRDRVSGHLVMSSTGLTPQVAASGWDILAKEPILKVEELATESVDVEDIGEIFGAFETGQGGGQLLASSQPEADVAASVSATVSANRAAYFEVTTDGRPDLRSGSAVRFADFGTPFDGKYVASHVRHHYQARSGYSTTIVVSGTDDESVGGMVSASEHNLTDLHGLYPAVVTANRDEEVQAGRVKVRFPWLGDDVESGWVRCAMAGSGADRGICFLPEIDDEVLVGFEAGDPARPIVIGALHNGKDKPPINLDDQVGGDGKVIRRAVVSRTGHRVVFVDKDGSESIEIVTGNKEHKLVLDQGGSVVELSTSGDLLLNAGGNVTIDAGGSVAVTAMGEASVKASGTTTIKGATVALNPPGA